MRAGEGLSGHGMQWGYRPRGSPTPPRVQGYPHKRRPSPHATTNASTYRRGQRDSTHLTMKPRAGCPRMEGSRETSAKVPYVPRLLHFPFLLVNRF